MKYLQMVLVAMVFAFLLNFATGSNPVFADDRYDHYYEKYEGYGKHRHDGKGNHGPYEELGEILGWGTVIAMGAAGVSYILRRSMKTVINKFPDAKSIFVSIARFFGKYHIAIGGLALAVGLVHGGLMYLSEGRLDGDGLIGLASLLFMAIAGVIGAVLSKKKKVKSLRTTHTVMIGLAIVIALIHVVGA